MLALHKPSYQRCVRTRTLSFSVSRCMCTEDTYKLPVFPRIGLLPASLITCFVSGVNAKLQRLAAAVSGSMEGGELKYCAAMWCGSQYRSQNKQWTRKGHVRKYPSDYMRIGSKPDDLVCGWCHDDITKYLLVSTIQTTFVIKSE
jgi:hypothetical protein